jgi:uncharacterized delta-60 repeat protein
MIFKYKHIINLFFFLVLIVLLTNFIDKSPRQDIIELHTISTKQHGRIITSAKIQKDGKTIIAGWEIKKQPIYTFSKVSTGKAQNGTGGGNRQFDAKFNNISTTSFSGSDHNDQGYGFFPVSIIKGKKYKISAKILGPKHNSKNIITSNGTDFFQDQVQLVASSPSTGSYEFTAIDNAKYIGFGSIYNSGVLNFGVSDFFVEETSNLSHPNNDYINKKGSFYYHANFFIIRYNIDGSLDYEFGKNGEAVTDIAFTNNLIFDLTVQSDGKILVIGSLDGENKNIIIARFKSNGTLDGGFGRGGIVITKVKSGDILILGSVFDVKNDKKFMQLYDYRGELYENFGKDKSGTVNLHSMIKDDGLDIIAQSDDKFLLLGSLHNKDFITRYNVDGSMDQNFGSSGYFYTDFDQQEKYSNTVLFSDNTILLSGYINNEFALLKLDSNGMPSTGFGNKGVLMTDIGKAATTEYIATTLNDEVLVFYRLFGKRDLYIKRFSGNGLAVDSKKYKRDFDVDDSVVYSSAYKDNKLIVVNKSEKYNIFYTYGIKNIDCLNCSFMNLLP